MERESHSPWWVVYNVPLAIAIIDNGPEINDFLKTNHRSWTEVYKTRGAVQTSIENKVIHFPNQWINFLLFFKAGK